MNLLDGPYIFGNPSALLLRSEFIRGRERFYSEQHPGADTQACLEVLRHSDFGFVFQVLSFMREHDESVTASNQDLNTSAANYLYVFRQFSNEFLLPEERRIRERELIRSYYRILGANMSRFRQERFLTYHRNAFKRIGLSWSWWRLVQGALYEFLRWTVDTKSHLKSAAGAVERRLR